MTLQLQGITLHSLLTLQGRSRASTSSLAGRGAQLAQHQRDADTRQRTQQRESTWHQVSPRVQVMPQHLATPSTALRHQRMCHHSASSPDARLLKFFQSLAACVIPAARQDQAHARPEWRGSSCGRAIQTARWQWHHSIPVRVEGVHQGK